MRRTQTNGINLYESYLQQTKREQNEKSSKLLTWILPLALLLLILLGVAGKLFLDNKERQETLDALDAQIAAMSKEYDDARALEALRDEKDAAYQSLAGARFLFEMYPAPTKDLFKQVLDCADNIFNISQYEYVETMGRLVIDASADSVNEVPQFVQRLRDTGLFSLVQYIGYTSNDSKRYFCTVSCTLASEGASFSSEELNAENGAKETADETAQDEQTTADTPA